MMAFCRWCGQFLASATAVRHPTLTVTSSVGDRNASSAALVTTAVNIKGNYLLSIAF